MPSRLADDAIPDRIVHNAHRIQLRGESLRKKTTSRTMGHAAHWWLPNRRIPKLVRA